jgi:hypothetical protein
VVVEKAQSAQCAGATMVYFLGLGLKQRGGILHDQGKKDDR